MRTVVAPTNDATFVETPFFSRNVEVLAERRPGDVVLDVALKLGRSASSSTFSGPMDSPSPITSSVTPCRMSLCDRPSWINDSVAQLNMLMKPGATARPRASISSAALARLKSPTVRDLIAANANVDPCSRSAGAVINRSTTNDDVVTRSRGARGQPHKRTKDSRSDHAMHAHLLHETL